MTFRVEGTSVVRSTEDGPDVGVCLALTADMAQRIADALNESSTAADLRGRSDPLSGERVARLDIEDRTPLSEVLGDRKFVKVVGPYATIEMGTPDGRQVRALAPGSVLPGDVPAGKARHLVDVGLAQVVEAGSPGELYEGAPTERQRVLAASLDPSGPTAGAPAEGSVEARYDEDPIAAAREAAAPGGPTAPVLISGAGQGVAGDEELVDLGADGGPGGAPARPHGNASLETWADYHVSRLVADGTSEEDARAQIEGKSRDELRALRK